MEAGWVVRDSHFESCGAAVFVGGGRQTTVENNTFINCTLPVSVRYNCTCTFGLANLLRLKTKLRRRWLRQNLFALPRHVR